MSNKIQSTCEKKWSLSSRRAWIEIGYKVFACASHSQVALLTESVDWNLTSLYWIVGLRMSLSSRRAWIEINKTFKELFEYLLSLSSRRAWIEILWLSSHLALDKSRSPHGERGLKLLLVEATSERAGRSPHGERGLKCVAICGRCKAYRSLSSRRAWIEI